MRLEIDTRNNVIVFQSAKNLFDFNNREKEKRKRIEKEEIGSAIGKLHVPSGDACASSRGTRDVIPLNSSERDERRSAGGWNGNRRLFDVVDGHERLIQTDSRRVCAYISLSVMQTEITSGND